MAAKHKPNELYIERVYDAPVKMVWEAWVDPEQVGKWWGPRGFSITTKQKDVRPGGTWTYTMLGPDGTVWPNITHFREVEKYKKLVYDHGGNETEPPLFQVTVLFTDVSGKTKMEMWMAMKSEDDVAATKKRIPSVVRESTWDRLAEFLDDAQGRQDTFVTNRTFDASIGRMYEVWTNPNHFAKWLPPTGFTQTILKGEIKPGGEIFYRMDGPDGMKMYGKIFYKEIVEPSKLVYSQIFSNEEGDVARHPMSPTWPERMLTTVQLYAETSDTTRVQITWTIEGNATDAERKTFHDAKAGMTQGWGGSFEKLERYLAQS